MLIQLVSALALAATPVPVAPSPQQAPPDAFLDGGAAELLRKARERRTMIDRSVTGYTAVVQEHISAGLRTLARERMIFGRDVAGRVEWNRGGPVRNCWPYGHRGNVRLDSRPNPPAQGLRPSVAQRDRCRASRPQAHLSRLTFPRGQLGQEAPFTPAPSRGVLAYAHSLAHYGAPNGPGTH